MLLQYGPLDANTITAEMPCNVWAAHYSHGITKLFLRKGADADACNGCGIRAIHVAAQNSDERVAQVLIEHGCDIHAKTNDGVTPLRLALEKRNDPVVRLLCQHGANLSAEEEALSMSVTIGTKHIIHAAHVVDANMTAARPELECAWMCDVCEGAILQSHSRAHCPDCEGFDQCMPCFEGGRIASPHEATHVTEQYVKHICLHKDTGTLLTTHDKDTPVLLPDRGHKNWVRPTGNVSRIYSLYQIGHARFAVPGVPPENYKVTFEISAILAPANTNALRAERAKTGWGKIRMTAGTLKDEASKAHFLLDDVEKDAQGLQSIVNLFDSSHREDFAMTLERISKSDVYFVTLEHVFAKLTECRLDDLLESDDLICSVRNDWHRDVMVTQTSSSFFAQG
jgi:hypothetical protein